MFIQTIIKYDFHDAIYVVTDGKNHLNVLNQSVPHKNDLFPEVGMAVKTLIAHGYKEICLNKISEAHLKCDLIEKGNNMFDYKLRGIIKDLKKALILINGFTISLEKHFKDGLPDIYQTGDYVEFCCDYIDSTLN